MTSHIHQNKQLTDHPKWADIATRLEKIGLREFSHQEIKDIHERLLKSISIGLNRQGAPSITDGGVLAAPTGVQTIILEQVQQVPDHTRGITAACGGTNWIFAETQKEPSGQVTIGRSVVRKIPENERKQTYDSFMEIIADGIFQLATQCDLLNEATLPISISLGFPQITVETKGGDIDARIPRRKLPKFWEITDYDESLPPLKQPSLAELIKNKLRTKGVKGVKRVVIVNDTVAVALDVQHEKTEGADAPVGFVFGTGTNGAMYAGPKQGIVNLEIGHAEVMDQDAVLEVMQKHGWAPDHRLVMEYWMGGAFIPARVMAGVELLSEFVSDPKAINQQILSSHNQALMSDMAKGRQSPLVGLSLVADDYLVAQICAKRALHQAAQLIGVHFAAVCQAVEYTKGMAFIPYEGSVLGKGYQVKRKALETAKLLLPQMELKPYEASGMVGVAKLAMVRLFK